MIFKLKVTLEARAQLVPQVLQQLTAIRTVAHIRYMRPLIRCKTWRHIRWQTIRRLIITAIHSRPSIHPILSNKN